MPALAKARVLTVEDDPIVRADLRLILGDAGFDVCPDGRSGIEAIELARVHRPDLVLIDLDLPGVDGVEATRRILDERRVPIVALTGHSSGDFVERAIDAGAVAHVLKPFDEAHLVGTIRGALSAYVPDEQSRVLALRAEDHYQELVLIESLVRRNSEREIVAALGGRYEWERDWAAVKRFALRMVTRFRG